MLDNELRPGVLVTVTVALDPYLPIVAKQVRTREMRFVQDTAIGQTETSLSPQSLSKTYWAIGGTVTSKKHDPSTLSAVLVEKKLAVELDEDGNFAITGIEAGEYNLDILFNGKVLKRQKITVPAPNYDVEI